jgi:hypothetical protein
MEMSNTINLGKEVIVSDPSYEIPTWCQKIVKGVLAGEYQTFCKKYDTGDWGNRVSMLMVVHNDHNRSVAVRESITVQFDEILHYRQRYVCSLVFRWKSLNICYFCGHGINTSK